LAPQWIERSPADLGIALVELLAYAADQLSYYQDAVANEAYLETARQRISVRRHARLIDYAMHDGASARTFVHVGSDEPGTIPAATPVLSRITQPIEGAIPGPVIDLDQQTEAQDAAGAVFETMEAAYVHQDLCEISLYAWGNRQCCLPRGSTQLDLVGNLTPWFSSAHLVEAGMLASRWRDGAGQVSTYIQSQLPPATLLLLSTYHDGNPVPPTLMAALVAGLNHVLADSNFYRPGRFAGIALHQAVLDLIDENPQGDDLVRLNRFLLEVAYFGLVERSAKLQAGDHLFLEEVIGPETGLAADADPDHRQIVRLTSVVPTRDPLLEQELTSVTWGLADALTFPVCLSAKLDDTTYIDGITVARGNLILADHGHTVSEEIHTLPAAPPAECQRRPHRFLLDKGPLSFRVPSPSDNGHRSPAVQLFQTDPGKAHPQVIQMQVEGTLPADDWEPVPHLLDSDGFDHHFAVETDNHGQALLRFGDDEYGAAPPDTSKVTVDYRIGVGAKGNVGADALVHLIDLEAGDDWPDVSSVRNPLAAWGGIDPEPMDRVKQLAPAAFHAVQLRAVTEADYALAAAKHPEVAKAVATFRWTGSWHTVFITVDPVGRTDLPQDLQERVRAWVTRFTQAGYDLEIDPPTFVPLEIEMDVCVCRRHFRAHVQQALLDALSSRVRSHRKRGFFHPDNFTFGQALYLSQLYAVIEAVEGVDSAEIKVFKRFGKLPNNELAQGYIPMGRLEVVRLDNDPSLPENGVLRLNMLGGK